MSKIIKNKIIFIFLLISVIIISGCTSQSTPPVCRNNIVESGEDCDNSECPTGYSCSECKCEALTPPPIPE